VTEASPIRERTPHWPRLLNEGLAAAYLSIGTTTLWKRGPAPRRIGRRALWDIRDLDRWADRLADQPLDEKGEQEEAAEVERRFLERMRGSV
jgi:hypothetical protein